MASLNDSNATDDLDQSQVVLRGGTDNTKIGNVGDRLKVDTTAVVSAEQETSFRPDPSGYNSQESVSLKVDSSENLICRSSVLTDEGSFRTCFNGDLEHTTTGTATFVNGSDVVNGIGTLFLSEVKFNDYIKLSSDGTDKYRRIAKVISDTELWLVLPYAGSSATGAIKYSEWRFNATGTGASVTQSSSQVLINAGTANANISYIERSVDYLPLTLYMDTSVALRQANQEIVVGFMDDRASPTKEASVIFNGTQDNIVIFRTRSGSSLTQETIVYLGGSFKTSSNLDYEINVLANKCILVIEGKTRAVHTDNIPFPYDVLYFVAKSTNTGVVSSNNLAIDGLYIANINVVSVANSFSGEALKVEVVSPVASTSLNGFIDGYVQTASTALTTVRNTTYTEQTTNAQRSIKSSSANDTAAGTGARTLLLTYYDQNLVGPYTETITLNGTTAVNTVNTNICYIESIELLTVGSGGVAAGTISIYTTTGGGGSAFGSIAASTTKTFWCHHYVSSGIICQITSLTISTNGTVAGNGARFYLTSTKILTANSVNQQISDNITVPGSVSFETRPYSTPILVHGPARILGWALPNSGATYINFLSFDFNEA